MQRSTKETFKIFWQHSRVYPWSVFGLLFSIVAASAVALVPPLFYRKFFNALTEGGATFDQLFGYITYAFSALFVMWALWRVATFTNSYFQSSVMRDLYRTCFAYLHGHSFTFFNNNFAGSLVRKVNKYYKAYEEITDQFMWAFLPALTATVFILTVLFYNFPVIGWVVLVWIVVYVYASYRFSVFKLKYDIDRSEMDSKVTGFLSDTVTNNANIKLYSALPFEIKSFRNITQDWWKKMKFSWDLGMWSEAVQGFLMIALEFCVMYIGLRLWQKGQITPGDFVLLQSYLLSIFDKLWNLGRNVRRIFEGVSDANEMTEILLKPYGVEDVPGARVLKLTEPRISFKNIGFHYSENRKILSKFNLEIEPGEKVAFVGPSGGGKTTIVKLLLRFLDVQKGEILVSNINIREVTQDSLRSQIALVPQEPLLFHRTLMENIRYGKPGASDKEVFQAAKQAHCHEFISKLEHGYETYVGERGVKLSGGERQRVAIARAILKNAPILVLDEATSSLDSESERLIQDALHNLMKGKTVLVIAHRLSTIMQMDRIVVIENGKIKEQGKHAELLKVKQGIYQKLWGIQAGGFETKPA